MLCWDIARTDQPGSYVRGAAGPSNGPDDGARPTADPGGPRTGTTGPGQTGTEHGDATPRPPGPTGPGQPGTKHADTVLRPRRRHGGTDTTRPPGHGELKVSNRKIPAGHREGRTVPPPTYEGRLKVSGRTDPAGRNSTARALWEQLQRHGRRLGSLSSLA